MRRPTWKSLNHLEAARQYQRCNEAWSNKEPRRTRANWKANAAPDDDPYPWLEQSEGAPALNIANRQNSRTLEVFGGSADERDRDALTAIYDRLYAASGGAPHWKSMHAEPIMGDPARPRSTRRQRRRGQASECHGRTARNSFAVGLESIARRKRSCYFAEFDTDTKLFTMALSCAKPRVAA